MVDGPAGVHNLTLMRVLRSAARLQEPAPKDRSTTRNLRQYKNLAARWQDWDEVISICRRLATAMVGGP